MELPWTLWEGVRAPISSTRIRADNRRHSVVSPPILIIGNKKYFELLVAVVAAFAYDYKPPGSLHACSFQSFLLRRRLAGAREC